MKGADHAPHQEAGLRVAKHQYEVTSVAVEPTEWKQKFLYKL